MARPLRLQACDRANPRPPSPCRRSAQASLNCISDLALPEARLPTDFQTTAPKMRYRLGLQRPMEQPSPVESAILATAQEKKEEKEEERERRAPTSMPTTLAAGGRFAPTSSTGARSAPSMVCATPAPPVAPAGSGAWACLPGQLEVDGCCLAGRRGGRGNAPSPCDPRVHCDDRPPPSPRPARGTSQPSRSRGTAAAAGRLPRLPQWRLHTSSPPAT